MLQQINVKNVHRLYGAGIQTHNLLIMSLLPGLPPSNLPVLVLTMFYSGIHEIITSPCWDTEKNNLIKQINGR